MKRCPTSIRRVLVIGASCAGLVAPCVQADVLYGGLQNIAIPFGLDASAWDGVYLDIDTGATGTAEFTGWDVNPFFGGSLVAASEKFQPARIGANDAQPIIALASGVSVGSGLFPGAGLGSPSGSEGHLGLSAPSFISGQEAYLGFRFTANGGTTPNYGWMRVVFTQNASGGVIKDWAYETGGGAIQTGGVIRNATSAGVSRVDLAAAVGTTTTLASPLADLPGGTTTALSKTGSGTTVLAGDHTFTGSTTIDSGGGTLGIVGRLTATDSVAVNSGGTMLLSGPGGTDAKLNSAATVALVGGKIDLGGLTSTLSQSVGALTLSATSTLDFGALAGGHHWTFGPGQATATGLELRILNYTPGEDRLTFAGSPAPPSDLVFRISFYGDGGATLLGTRDYHGASGDYTPVPEPSTLTLAAALLALAIWRERRSACRARNPSPMHSRFASSR